VNLKKFNIGDVYKGRRIIGKGYLKNIPAQSTKLCLIYEEPKRDDMCLAMWGNQVNGFLTHKSNIEFVEGS